MPQSGLEAPSQASKEFTIATAVPFPAVADDRGIKLLQRSEDAAAPRSCDVREISKASQSAKDFVDFCISIGLLILLSPLFLVIAVLVKLDSRGPTFFLQKRCGKGGKEFFMLKFRTMVENAEALKSQLKNEVDGPMFKITEDPRVTRVGKHLRSLSLDELPQLINVARGEMSLVGPRPLAREEMRWNNSWMTARLSVKPGMTGLWQVKGRATRQFSDWVRYDTEYIQHRSLVGDIKILLLTIPAVIRRRGAV